VSSSTALFSKLAGATSSRAPFGRTSIPASAALSITTPPFFSKFSRAHSSRALGLTPQLRMSRVTIGGLDEP
jgi:hypothetical protein